jgi:hypothetical protein
VRGLEERRLHRMDANLLGPGVRVRPWGCLGFSPASYNLSVLSDTTACPVRPRPHRSKGSVQAGCRGIGMILRGADRVLFCVMPAQFV